ncbi:MAG: HAMP domain-containing histidine kinase [Chloroflexi bacterium]|nr:HAMP domain-containing histidine kinase [Chloroflexota bacterium]
MRSLRVKLILTFLAVSLTGSLIAAIIVRQSNERAFNTLLQEQVRGSFVDDALAYYVANGSWAGIGRRGHGYGVGFRRPDSPFALADENGRILIENGPYRRDTVIAAEELAAGIPLMVDEVQVGVVLPVNQPPPRSSEEQAYIRQINRALLMGALTATAVAIVLAIVLAQTLTRPLQELAAASRAMAAGDLEQQVPVRTQDELGDLATTFNQMSAELARANQQRRQMTADIAHDLRTPLTVLSGYLEAMEDGDLTPTPPRLQVMSQEVDTLKRLVEDLRTLSLADAGNLTLYKEPLDPHELLIQVQSAYAHQAAQQNVHLAVVASPHLPPAHVDPARLRQVLSNLVSNALRHTPTGGHITLRADPSTAKPDGLQLSVTDTGSGISPEDLPHIFDRFYRGDKARQEGGESGLGLAIAKSLIAAHGGAIQVTSTPGSGATFTILL